MNPLPADQADREKIALKDGIRTCAPAMPGLLAWGAVTGMVLVQSIETAKFDGMPKSAISTGLADFI
ncbi:MAG: CheB methylesterase, partial [Pseudomonadota bacterium]